MHCTCPEEQHVAMWARSWSYTCPLDSAPRIRDLRRPPVQVRSSQWVSQR